MTASTRRRAAQALVSLAAALGLLAGAVVATRESPPAPGPPAASATAGPEPAPSAEAVVRDLAGRTDAVDHVLDTWASAVQQGDTATLATLFDPRADPSFLTSETARATNLAQVPLTDWGYTTSDEPVPAVPPELVARLGADEVWAPAVQLHYAVTGADDRPTRRPVGVVVARRGETWRLVSDTALASSGRTTWRGPWDFGPVVVGRGTGGAAGAGGVGGGVVLGHPDQQVLLDRIADELVTAVPAVSAVWGTRWSRRALVEVASSQAELRALVGAALAAPGVAAVTTTDSVDRVADAATGVRVVFNPATLGQLDPGSLRVVLRHELTHVATRAVTVDGAPLWMLEGYADHVGYRGSGTSLAVAAPEVVARTRATGGPARLPSRVDLTPAGDGSTAQLGYQLAWTFTEFVSETRGEAALTSAYRAVAARSDPTDAELDAALVRTLGAPRAVLEQEWGAWLVARSG